MHHPLTGAYLFQVSFREKCYIHTLTLICKRKQDLAVLGSIFRVALGNNRLWYFLCSVSHRHLPHLPYISPSYWLWLNILSSLHDNRLWLHCKWGLRSPGILHNAEW